MTHPAQVALAWLLTKGDDIAPIPDTKRVHRVEENTAADAIELTAEQVAVLDRLTPPMIIPTLPSPWVGALRLTTRGARCLRCSGNWFGSGITAARRRWTS